MKTIAILLAGAAALSLSACGGGPKAGDNDAALNADLGNDAASGDFAGNSDALGDAGDLSGNVAVPADEGAAGNASGTTANAQ